MGNCSDGYKVWSETMTLERWFSTHLTLVSNSISSVLIHSCRGKQASLLAASL